MSVAFIGPQPAISHDGKPGQVSTIFLITVTQCFLMQHLTFEVMLSHVTHQTYKPFKNRLNVFMATISLIFALVWLVAPDFFNKNLKVYTFVVVILVLTVLCQWHFLLNTVSELAYALNISVFRVKDKSVDLSRPVDKSAVNDPLIVK